MGYPTNPPYPVVDREPSVRAQVAAFRASDWRNLAVATSASAPFGWYAGRPLLQVSTMFVATGIGAFGGLCMGLQSSFGRLTGYLPNEQEVASAPAPAPARSDLSEDFSL